MYVPSVKKLQGLTLETAECFGKPHVNAKYVGEGVNRYILEPNSSCPICGRQALNVHHQPPKGRGKILMLGGHFLRPSLFGLCGSGTMGCHGRIHGGNLKITWKWTSKDYAEAWWDGELLQKVKPHDQKLYDYGYWHFEQSIPSGKHFSDFHILL